jgi:fibrillarin-like rRNA methylase
MSQTSNQLFAPETAALIKRGGAKGTTSSSIIDVLMKKTEVSIVEIAAEKIRRELTQRN